MSQSYRVQYPRKDANRADLVDEVHPNSQFYKRIADFETAELIKVIRQRP